jgi:ATP-dependent Lon protease
MATSLASVFTNRVVRKNLAMTGEVTLRGRVLPIGGLREKSLAAMRAGIKQVIIPKKNQKDLAELPPKVKKNLEFIPVEHMDEVLEIALLAGEKGKKKTGARRAAPKRRVVAAKKKSATAKKTKTTRKKAVRKKSVR